VGTELGLRERKKQQTRRRIRDVAFRLFAERGFDSVPVAEVARAAEVAEATLFSYFATKEDLIYGEMEAFDRELLDAVRARPAGTTVVAAFRDVILQPQGALSSPDPEAIPRLATTAKIIGGSAALQAREQRLVDRTTRALTELIADEAHAPADDIRPWVVANALTGVNRAMTNAIHRHAIAGQSAKTITRAVLADGRRAFDLLDRGLAGYARKRDGIGQS
jgi:AcrR family transcriptional regulator